MVLSSKTFLLIDENTIIIHARQKRFVRKLRLNLFFLIKQRLALGYGESVSTFRTAVLSKQMIQVFLHFLFLFL